MKRQATELVARGHDVAVRKPSDHSDIKERATTKKLFFTCFFFYLVVSKGSPNSMAVSSSLVQTNLCTAYPPAQFLVMEDDITWLQPTNISIFSFRSNAADSMGKTGEFRIAAGQPLKKIFANMNYLTSEACIGLLEDPIVMRKLKVRTFNKTFVLSSRILVVFWLLPTDLSLACVESRYGIPSAVAIE
jgi:hypothetical protein